MFKIQFYIQFHILVSFAFYHHRLKAITHIKYSLNFAIRHLWDADKIHIVSGSQTKSDEKYLHKLFSQ